MGAVMATGGAPLGILCSSIQACCKYIANQEYRMIKQPVYGKYADGTEDPIGSITQVQRVVPAGPLCAVAEPIRVAIAVPVNPASGAVPNLGLAAMSYQGLEIPCRPKACCGAPFQQPMGIPCLDVGLGVETEYDNFQGMLSKDKQ